MKVVRTSIYLLQLYVTLAFTLARSTVRRRYYYYYYYYYYMYRY